MLKDIVEVRPLGGHRLSLRFEDGVTGEIDVGDLVAYGSRHRTRPVAVPNPSFRSWGEWLIFPG